MADGLQSSPPEIDLASAQRILDNAGAGLEAATVDELGEGVKSDAWLIGCSNGDRYVAKVYKSQLDHCAATEDAFHDQLEQRAPNGVPGIPRRLTSIDEQSIHARRITVHEFVPGVTMQAEAGFTESEQLPPYRDFGRTLRSLHGVRQPTFGSLPATDEAGAVRTNREFMEQLTSKALADFVADHGNRYLAGHLRAYFRDRAELWDQSTDARLCHGDTHPGNVVVERCADRSVAFRGVIDFESAIAGDPVFDLANAYYNASGDREAKFSALLVGYGEIVGDWRDRFDLYVVHFALSRWNFISRYGVRPPLRGISRELALMTGASQWGMLRGGLRRVVASG
mgnify:CR=1 FL=1